MRRGLLFLCCCGWLCGCAGAPSHPCSDGGAPARETPFRGNRQCEQRRGPDGKYVNDGIYREWHPNGRLALEGHYREGRQDGRWTLWDENGRKISERVYDNGVEKVSVHK